MFIRTLWRALALLSLVLCACGCSAGRETTAPIPGKTPEAELPARDPIQIAQRMGNIPAGDAPKPSTLGSPPQKVGDRGEFWVNDALTNTYWRATATLRLATPELCMWVEDGYQVRDDDLEASAQYFARVTLPTAHRAFGEEWTPGVDGDPRLHIFNGRVTNAGAYFYSQDEYPSAVVPRSNEREMFFVNLDTASPGTDGYNALLAHELQHMIHWHNDSDEEAWVNEGLSELSTRLSGLPVYNHVVYLRSPDIALMDWPLRTANSGPHYGGNYLLMEYLLGRFGDGFVRELAQHTANGIAGIDQALHSRGADFLSVFRDWTAANLLGDASLGDGRYGYPSIQFPQPEGVQILALPAAISDTVQPFGADYISVIPASTVHLEFAGSSSVRLAPFASEEGDHLWWSNRGDNKDTTLTREVDLSGATSATLHASIWYSLEGGWDFAHAEVSTDGGSTWQVLPGQHTRPAAHDSMALGPGYSGQSGGGGQPQWVEETYSLTAFAGRRILMRFECISDDTINLDGFWIRRLEIPEIGWVDEGESSEGWDARGFVRVENLLPQQYLLTAVLHGAGPQVIAIPVAADGSASAVLEAPEGLILIVSPVTPHTRQAASYSLRLW